LLTAAACPIRFALSLFYKTILKNKVVPCPLYPSVLWNARIVVDVSKKKKKKKNNNEEPCFNLR
jgi:hypothetical protein